MRRMPATLLSRRDVLVGAGALAVVAFGGSVRAQSRTMTKRTRLVMLATGGGPRPRVGRGNTAHAVVIDEVLYVVDCGSGVARPLAVGRLALLRLGRVSI